MSGEHMRTSFGPA